MCTLFKIQIVCVLCGPGDPSSSRSSVVKSDPELVRPEAVVDHARDVLHVEFVLRPNELGAVRAPRLGEARNLGVRERGGFVSYLVTPSLEEERIYEAP